MANPGPQPATSITDEEVDRARLDLIRRRVTAFGAAIGGILIALTILQWWLLRTILATTDQKPKPMILAAGLLTGVVLLIVPRLRRRALQKRTLKNQVQRTIWMVVMSVLSQFAPAAIVAKALTAWLHTMGLTGTNLGTLWPLLVLMVCVHTTAALIVPWTIREAALAPAIWIGVIVASPLLGNPDTAVSMAYASALTALAGAPGILISALRSTRLRERLGFQAIGARYAEVERELTFARRLHERLFAPPLSDGPIRLAYAYEPMRQIGGDYLDVTPPQGGSRWVVLIDVTGHGVAAALAVNRLHGELKRLLAQGVPGPAALLAELNRYVYLTLSDESVFATAAACRVSDEGVATLAVAGHPPPMLRSPAGIRLVDPTAPMLGAFAPDAFETAEETLRLGPGDHLILYTDGATEARTPAGVELGIEGFRRLVQASTDPHRLIAAVRDYRRGPAEDDVLIAALRTA